MASLPARQVLYDVHDAKIGKLLTDDTTNGVTYDSLIDIPVIQEFKFSPKTTSKELKGDGAVVDQRTALDYYEVEIRAGAFTYDALEVLFGGTVEVTTDPTTGDVTARKITVKKDSESPYFGLVVVSKASEYDEHFKFLKCKVEDYSINGKVDDYWVIDLKLRAIGTEATGEVYVIQQLAPDTAPTLP